MNGGQHQIIWYFSACKVTKHRKSTCTKWSSPWLRGAGALHWCSTAGCHTIPISFLPASRNNLRKKTQPVRSSQSCSTKENQRICFRPTPVSISGSITDALKVLVLIPPLCAPVPQHRLSTQRDLLQALHPSKSSSPRHCPALAAPLVCPKVPK